MDTLDRTIAGRGVDEAAWQASAWLASLPFTDFTTLLGNCDRIVVLSPHPDDETLGCGGLMFEARRRGIPVLVCSVTRGEKCYPALTPDAQAALGRLRHAELVQAVTTLGLDPSAVTSWAFEDGALAGQDAALQARLLEAVRPGDLIVAPWERDGHPDHEALGNVARAVAGEGAYALLRYPVWGWHWSAHPEQGLAAEPAMRFALPADALSAKRRAIDAFASQIEPDMADVPPILPQWVLARFTRDFEVYLA